MVTKVPTMSTAGWVDSIADKADRLVSYYFISDFSQTHLYPGQITSLPYQVQQAGHDQVELRRMVQEQLSSYLSHYFDSADVRVRTDLPAPNDPNRINITIEATVVENGERYQLGRLINAVNSKIVDIVNINNFGA